MEASNQSHRFVHKKIRCTLWRRFWACDRSHSGVDILVHVPNLQHLGIPEYVKKSSETVYLFLKTALFLNFYFFRSESCGSDATYLFFTKSFFAKISQMEFSFG